MSYLSLIPCPTLNLIGVSIKGRPRIGVIHKPYHSKNESGDPVGKTYLGSIECGLFLGEYNSTYIEGFDHQHIHRNFMYQEPFRQEKVLAPNQF